MNALPFTITPASITVFFADRGDQVSIANTHPNFEAVKLAIKEKRWDEIYDLVNVAHAVREFIGASGKLELIDGQVYYDGEQQTGSVVDQILRLKEEGFDINPLIAFFERLQKNPSFRVRNDVFDWLQNGQMPISDDGYVIAFKKINNNYTDVHSGRFDNSVGKIVQVDRSKVDDDFNKTCSHGLHFCSRGYLPHFGGTRIVVLKIDPADIVAFPTDYNLSKGRCCKYEVISEIENPQLASEELTDAVYESDEPEIEAADEGENDCPYCNEPDQLGRYCSECGADLG